MSDEETNCDTEILLEELFTSVSKNCSDSPETGVSRRPAGESRRHSYIVPLASVIAAMGGLLFGYDVGIISGALLLLEAEWQMDCFKKQLIVSSMLFGAFAASCVGGAVVDKAGRRWTIIFTSIVFIIGALILAFSQAYTVLIIGRVVVGFAVALSAVSECIYISEISPPNKRGFLVSLNELGITVGFLVAYFVNYILSEVQSAWRLMFGISAIPAMVQLLGMLFLPSTPHFLMLQKREDEAEAVLCLLRGRAEVRQELTNIRLAIDEEKNYGFCSLFASKDNMRYRMCIGVGLVLFQQMTGQPNVLYYASFIFESVGFCMVRDATFASVILGIIKLLATVLFMLLVDRAGRRVFLLFGAFLMALSISCLGVVALSSPSQFKPAPCQDLAVGALSHFNDSVHMDNFDETLFAMNVSKELHLLVTSSSDIAVSSTDGSYTSNRSKSLNRSKDTDSDRRVHCVTSAKTPSLKKWMAVAALMVYVASYSIGFGPVTWLILSEIFPTALKGQAFAFATAVNWGTNILISSTFMDVMTFLSVGMTFLGYGMVALIALLFIFLTIPETKNRSLQQLSKEIQQTHLQSSTGQLCMIGFLNGIGQHYQKLTAKSNVSAQ